MSSWPKFDTGLYLSYFWYELEVSMHSLNDEVSICDWFCLSRMNPKLEIFPCRLINILLREKLILIRNIYDQISIDCWRPESSSHQKQSNRCEYFAKICSVPTKLLSRCSTSCDRHILSMLMDYFCFLWSFALKIFLQVSVNWVIHATEFTLIYTVSRVQLFVRHFLIVQLFSCLSFRSFRLIL